MLQFNKLVVHNFGSYAHAEINLQSKGFCLVSGENHFKKDNALSNGSGKSFIWSALCFALTGETINGLKTNLKNINLDEDSCYTSIDFAVTADRYLITRYISPKSDLKIIKNDIDVSGKGIRESEKKLGELLPDLNKDLIASTIIIGQGMPNKFSSFSPSGRKELLEKLTKSDFMIEDIKSRVANRSTELNSKVREYEDSTLTLNTQLKMAQSSLNKLKLESDSLKKPDFDALLNEATTKLTEAVTNKTTNKADLKNIEDSISVLNNNLLIKTDEKSNMIAEELAAYTESVAKLKEEKLSLTYKINSLKAEITKLKSIKDICPTCHQKLPNVEKQDTSKQEAEQTDLEKALLETIGKINMCDKKHLEYTKQISDKCDADIQKLKQDISNLKLETTKIKNMINSFESTEKTLNESITKFNYDKLNWEKYCANLKISIEAAQLEEATLLNKIGIVEAAMQEIKIHLGIVRKMDTLIKRDFRGYLLTNIIKYIDTKAKDYSDIVFGTRDLNVYLDGNSLDISYNNKMFDNLSGGEKQRVDLILQFAIRNMLNAYLNTSSNILVLDEITDFLDKQSCGAIMKLLETELTTIESVFIVSHHADELALPIDSEIKIVKNEEGISEVY